jgi:hypothetical protein
MMGSVLRNCAAFVLFLAIFSSFSAAFAIEYAFTTIVDNQSQFTSVLVNSVQPLNDSGEVAFYGESVADFKGIYKSDGSTVTTIAEYSQTFLTENSGINEGGSVIFRADGSAYERALNAGSGGTWTTYLYENTFDDPNPAWLITGAASINDSDQVAFSGGWTSNPLDENSVTRQGYYRVNGAGGSVTVMAESGHGVYNGASALPPALNDAGKAAFMMRTVADGKYQVLRYDNSGVTTIATGFSGPQIVSMNSSGDVAFVNQNSTAVQVYGNGGLQTIASTADGFDLLFAGAQFINDAGKVVFAGNVEEYEGSPVNWSGVFNGPDTLNDQVLLHGDSLYGKTVMELELLDLNNLGQILMMVGLSGPEDWRGLVLATPVNSADFDDDGYVDGQDFLNWQRGVGLTGQATNSLGDANFNGGVDGDDLDIWQQQYGTSLQSATSTAVPEPGSLFAVLFALGAATIRRMRLHLGQRVIVRITGATS